MIPAGSDHEVADSAAHALSLLADYGEDAKFVRRANDWAIVGVAAYDGRVALASMGGTPLRALAVEEALRSGAPAAEAASHAAEGTSPGYDFHADADFRKHLARVRTRRALEAKTGWRRRLYPRAGVADVEGEGVGSTSGVGVRSGIACSSARAIVSSPAAFGCSGAGSPGPCT